MKSTAVFAGANALGFGISMATGSHLHLDLIGTGAFVVAAAASVSMVPGGASLWVGLGAPPLSAICVGLWGTRLAGFLFYRATETGHDGRLDDLLETTSGTFQFWAASLVWGVVCSLPHTLAAVPTASASFLRNAKLPAPKSPLLVPLCAALGVVIFAAGLTTEVVADLQKYRFKQDIPGRYCDEGLWVRGGGLGRGVWGWGVNSGRLLVLPSFCHRHVLSLSCIPPPPHIPETCSLP